MAADPYPRLPRFDRQSLAFLSGLEHFVLDVEARVADRDDPGLDDDVVAESRGKDEPRARVDHRIADDVEFAQQVAFLPPRRLEQMVRRGVEHGEIAGVIDDAGRVAIGPFDPYRVAIDQHRPSGRGDILFL